MYSLLVITGGSRLAIMILGFILCIFSMVELIFFLVYKKAIIPEAEKWKKLQSAAYGIWGKVASVYTVRDTDDNIMYMVRYEYQDDLRNAYTGTFSYNPRKKEYAVGDEVKILYNPENPSESKEAEEAKLIAEGRNAKVFRILLISFGIAIVLLVAGIICVVMLS